MPVTITDESATREGRGMFEPHALRNPAQQPMPLLSTDVNCCTVHTTAPWVKRETAYPCSYLRRMTLGRTFAIKRSSRFKHVLHRLEWWTIQISRRSQTTTAVDQARTQWTECGRRIDRIDELVTKPEDQPSIHRSTRQIPTQSAVVLYGQFYHRSLGFEVFRETPAEV